MQIAQEMTVLGDHFFSDEFCFFDGNHKRVRGFVTLTASVYHSLLASQIILATMQCKHEHKKCVDIFWRTFNQAYKDVNGVDKQFNPIGWCTDMATSNFTGISAVYGEEVLDKMNGCEFHFNHRSIFHSLANDMLHATTTEAYNKAYSDFSLFLTSNNETKDQITWLKWWSERKNLMFKAFTSIDAPSNNLAEVLHDGWKNSKDINLSLLNCTCSDVKSCLLLHMHLEDVKSGNYDGGRGPSQGMRLKRKANKEVIMANLIGQHFIDYQVDMTITPTMAAKNNFIGDDEGCEPKKKSVQRNKLLTSQLGSARNLKYTMKIADVTNINAEHRLFEVSSNGRSFYQVRICTQPSRSCPDFAKHGNKVFCKQILFVLLFALGI